MSPFQLTPFGAARMTTGSRHLLEIGGKRILLDCGLVEGKRAASREKNSHFQFDPASLDAVILSHAHIDHSGNLPTLVKKGFRGNIYATPATRDLCALMLQDSAKVQLSDAAFFNKRQARHHQDRRGNGHAPEGEISGAIEPLYTAREAEQALRHFVTVDYRRPFPVADGVTAEFLDAGHLLGSAQVQLDLHPPGEKRTVRLLFSGDVGRGHSDILRDPEAAENVDVLLMESTYGSRLHEDTASAGDVLCQVVNRTRERGGKIIIPSFAVGRAQQLVWALHQLREVDCFPAVPIYVDSPLSVNATEVFRLHPECFNQELYDYLHDRQNPFGWEDITYVRDVEQSKKLNELEGTAILISASGMCEAGRILHHLRNNIGDPRNTILFIGFCAEHTLGHKILRGDKTVNIFGEPVEVRAEVARIDAYSGHADRNELLAYAARVGGPKRKIVLVHGEENEGLALQEALAKAYPHSQVSFPLEGEAIPL
jgi:metallo-beta-lactamase family protein